MHIGLHKSPFQRKQAKIQAPNSCAVKSIISNTAALTNKIADFGS